MAKMKKMSDVLICCSVEFEFGFKNCIGTEASHCRGLYVPLLDNQKVNDNIDGLIVAYWILTSSML